MSKRKTKRSGNSDRFTIGGDELRDAANPHAALRRDRQRREAESRERTERSKELGDDSPMSADEFKLAVGFVRDRLGVVLDSTWSGYTLRPRITSRELFGLCTNFAEGCCYRDRI